MNPWRSSILKVVPNAKKNVTQFNNYISKIKSALRGIPSIICREATKKPSFSSAINIRLSGDDQVGLLNISHRKQLLQKFPF